MLLFYLHTSNRSLSIEQEIEEFISNMKLKLKKQGRQVSAEKEAELCSLNKFHLSEWKKSSEEYEANIKAITEEQIQMIKKDREEVKVEVLKLINEVDFISILICQKIEIIENCLTEKWDNFEEHKRLLTDSHRGDEKFFKEIWMADVACLLMKADS